MTKKLDENEKMINDKEGCFVVCELNGHVVMFRCTGWRMDRRGHIENRDATRCILGWMFDVWVFVPRGGFVGVNLSKWCHIITITL